MARNKPDELLRAIGRRIAEVRRSRGWTQEELAERLEVTGRYVQSVEAGGQNLSVRSLAFFADALDLRVVDLFRKPRTDPSRPLAPKRSRRARRG